MSKQSNGATRSSKSPTSGSQGLGWLHKGLNPERMARLAKAEIAEARTATSRPRHWRPVDVDETELR
jgi:hypothetical protein